MDNAVFTNEVDFGAAMLLIREMLDAGLITRLEYCKIEKMYIAKYKPVFHLHMGGLLNAENRELP